MISKCAVSKLFLYWGKQDYWQPHRHGAGARLCPHIPQAPRNWLFLSRAEIGRHGKGFSHPGAVLREVDGAGSAGTDIQNNRSIPFYFFPMDTT